MTSKRKRRFSRRGFLKLLLSGLLAGCAGRRAPPLLQPFTPLPASATPQPSPTPLPSATPTETPAPTATPIPTATPSPHAPVIGIVAHHLYAQSYGTHVDGQIDFYRRAVALAGGAPILIPLGLEEAQGRAIYEVLDGLLFPGGADVDPAHYGEVPHPRLGHVDPALDRLELLLARWALADGLPVLGSCRGAQLLNVAAGGTLVQDIPSQWPNALDHSSSAIDAHVVNVLPGSRLAGILGVTSCFTNSRHHQAVKEPGAGFVVAATTSDGLVEAIERQDAAFCVGVQWHPENLVERDPAMLRFFEAFVAASKK